MYFQIDNMSNTYMNASKNDTNVAQRHTVAYKVQTFLVK